MKYTSKSVAETKKIAEKFVDKLLKGNGIPVDSACIIALRGDLGSGKTTFVQSVAAALGIKETVTSPTFVLEKVYKIQDKKARSAGFSHLIHIDAYRLSGGEEMSALGWDELLQKRENLVFIEWPERVSIVIPASARVVDFVFVDGSSRSIDIR